MPEPSVGDHFPEDPTATEVEEQLRLSGLRADHAAEAARRRAWEDQHGPFVEDFDEFLAQGRMMQDEEEDFDAEAEAVEEHLEINPGE